MKKRLYEILNKSEKGDTLSSIFDWFIISIILLNMLTIILESFQPLSLRWGNYFKIFETLSVIIFTVEYLLRMYTSVIQFPDRSPIKAAFRFIFSFMALVDLFAILPFYLPFIIPMDMRFLRILRLGRLLRVLKLNRYSEAFSIIGRVVLRKKEQLIVTMFVTVILLLLSASIMYNIENQTQPESFPNIIASFWWAIATLTTVGYGDVYPVTVLGKILSALIALLGIGLVAIPTGIISAGFVEELETQKTSDSAIKKYCPYCGEKLID